MGRPGRKPKQDLTKNISTKKRKNQSNKKNSIVNNNIILPTLRVDLGLLDKPWNQYLTELRSHNEHKQHKEEKEPTDNNKCNVCIHLHKELTTSPMVQLLLDPTNAPRTMTSKQLSLLLTAANYRSLLKEVASIISENVKKQ
jgi:hypothetical protein